MKRPFLIRSERETQFNFGGVFPRNRALRTSDTFHNLNPTRRIPSSCSPPSRPTPISLTHPSLSFRDSFSRCIQILSSGQGIPLLPTSIIKVALTFPASWPYTEIKFNKNTRISAEQIFKHFLHSSLVLSTATNVSNTNPNWKILIYTFLK